MSTRLQRLPSRRPDVLLREDDPQTLLFPWDEDTTHVLNPTARAIWELCDGTTTIGELADAICEVFSVPRERAVADVAAVLVQLSEAGLVAWTEPPDGRVG